MSISMFRDYKRNVLKAKGVKRPIPPFELNLGKVADKVYARAKKVGRDTINREYKLAKKVKRNTKGFYNSHLNSITDF